MKVLHSWLREYVGEAMPSPDKAEELLTFHAFEIEGVESAGTDAVIDVDVLPNRSSDCLSHRGVAYELATLLDVPLAHDPLAQQPQLAHTDAIKVDIADEDACVRFTASVISGVTVKESPQWLKDRLEALGQRSINNIVDATNYVMLAIGQPIHAYDADKFPNQAGQWHFGVRFAQAGEVVSLLAEGGADEDRIVELTGSELLIVDGSSDTPVGLAGIKGGRSAELDAHTTNIIVEAAHFDPAVIRKTARRLGILTDASKRFENNPSAELPLYAQREVIELICKVAGGTCAGVVDASVKRPEPVTTVVEVDHVNALLGLTLSAEEIKRIIERTGATVAPGSGSRFSAVAPWWRTDLTIEADYIEEVGRIHGLSNIESVVPEKAPLTEINSTQYYSERIRQALLKVGYSEVITSSFLKKGKIQLQNALASDKSYVRNTLRKNIDKVIDANYVHTDLLGISGVRVFEIGTVFDKTEEGVEEHLVLALGARTKGNGYSQKDDAVLAEGVDAVAEALGTELNWQIEKGVAELNLSAVIAALPVPSAYEPLPERADVTYAPISPYPAIARDIALWVKGKEDSSAVAVTLADVAGNLLVRHTLFDTFEKDGRTSYAFRLVFQSNVRTLTDSEVNGVMEKLYGVAKEQGWEVR